MGLEAIERLRFLAPAPGTGTREGGEKMQPFNRFASHTVTSEGSDRILLAPHKALGPGLETKKLTPPCQ